MNEEVPRCVVEVESTVSGEYVRITLWREKTGLADIICKYLAIVLATEHKYLFL